MVATKARTAVTLLTVTLLAVLTLGPGVAGAQDGIEIDIEPSESFEETGDIVVTAEGLEDFEGGRAVVYQCANADTTGAPIAPTEDDCFPPANPDQYLIGEVVDGAFSATYPLQVRDIGANASQCVGLPPATTNCQIVVAASKGGLAAIKGAPVDELIDQLTADDAEVAGETETNDAPLTELPRTGLSTPMALMLGAAGLGLAYFGYLAWSAAAPARLARQRS